MLQLKNIIIKGLLHNIAMKAILKHIEFVSLDGMTISQRITF